MTNELPPVDAIISAVDLPDDITRMVTDLVTLTLDEMKYLIQHGSTPIKMQLYRIILSAATKDMNRSASEGDVVSELREKMSELFAEVREDVSSIPTPTPASTLDTPATRPNAEVVRMMPRLK
jgi:hypothetical protein